MQHRRRVRTTAARAIACGDPAVQAGRVSTLPRAARRADVQRAGWHLPGFPDRDWPRATNAQIAQAQPPGVTWYRTGFHLAVPAGQDVSIGLRFAGTGGAGGRALVFLNGWQVGHFIDAAGFQRDFVLPAGILRQQGDNTLALAVIAPDALPAGPAPVSLVVLGNQRGGVAVEDVDAPGFDPRDAAHP